MSRTPPVAAAGPTADGDDARREDPNGDVADSSESFIPEVARPVARALSGADPYTAVAVRTLAGVKPSPHVLLVDDSPSVARLVGAWLAGENLSLAHAATAEAAVDAARSERPDLILLDVDLPDGSGFDVCRRLKADQDLLNVPVVFLTGATSTEQKIRGLELGAVDYITKPFNPAEFRARLRAALRTKYLTDLLATRAQIDGLTGLRNRLYLYEQLDANKAIWRRSGRPFGLIMLDVDHFKAINDGHGHPFGDEVLRHVAGGLQATCREEDVVCRYGGEEFTILTPGVNAAGAGRLAERVRAAVAGLRPACDGREVRVRVSVGVADVGNDVESVVDRADAALYRAKRAGRDRVEIDPPTRSGGRKAALDAA